MIELVQGLLANQMVAGGAALGVTGGAIAALRNVPMRVVRWATKQCTVTADTISTESAHIWLKYWLTQHPYMKRSRKLAVAANYSQDKPTALLSPGAGAHWFFYKRRLVRLSLEQQALDKTMGGSPTERYNLVIMGRDQSIVKELFAEAWETYDKLSQDVARLFISAFGDWRSAGIVRTRALDSVVLPEGVAEGVLQDMREFLTPEAKAWYRRHGIPYRRGYLFEGVPGSGKSSLVTALAGELGRSVYVLNIGSPNMSDDRLQQLLNQVTSGSIILLEDIDAVTLNRSASPGKQKISGELPPMAVEHPVTLSGLLNALDSVTAREDCVIVMTTNHVEKLDPALVRPGRVDLPVSFGYADRSQLVRMFERFFEIPGEDFADRVGEIGRPVSMAEVQQHLLKYRNDAAAALTSVPALIASTGEVNA